MCSFGELVNKLQTTLHQESPDFECEIVQNVRVRKLTSDGARYKVEGTTTSLLYKNADDLDRSKTKEKMRWSEIRAAAVVLAIPQEPLVELDVDALLERGSEGDFKAKKREWRTKLRQVRAHRLAKLVHGYRNPWWRTGETPDGAGSLIITDLPLRQVYYWDQAWLAKRGRYEYYDEDGKIAKDQTGREPGIKGIVVAYLDGHYTAYWRFITTVQRLHATAADALREDEHGFTVEGAEEMEKRRCDRFGERVWGWPNPPEFLRTKWSGGERAAKWSYDRPFEEWADEERARYLYWYKHGLFERASTKMTHILEHLHASLDNGTAGKVEPPVVGAYTFWDDFGDEPIPEAGWHTWEPGAQSEECMDYMTQPFKPQKVYVCGEAYSSEQGWIEGALKSVERMMHGIGIDLGKEIREHIGVDPPPAGTPA